MKKLFLFWLLMAIAGAAHAFSYVEELKPNVIIHDGKASWEKHCANGTTLKFELSNFDYDELVSSLESDGLYCFKKRNIINISISNPEGCGLEKVEFQIDKDGMLIDEYENECTKENGKLVWKPNNDHTTKVKLTVDRDFELKDFGSFVYYQSESCPPKGTYSASFTSNDILTYYSSSLGSDGEKSMFLYIYGDLENGATEKEVRVSQYSVLDVWNPVYGITRIEIPVTVGSQLKVEDGNLTKNNKGDKYIWTCPDGEVISDIEILAANDVVINDTIKVTYDTRLQTPAEYSTSAIHNDCFGIRYTAEGSWKGGRRIPTLPGVSITTGSSNDTNWSVEDVDSSKRVSSRSRLEVENGIPVMGTFFKIEPRVNVAVNFNGYFPVGTYCIVDEKGKVVFEKEVTDATEDLSMIDFYDDNKTYHSFLEGSARPYYFYKKDAVGHASLFAVREMVFYPVLAYTSSKGAMAVRQLDMPTNSTVKMPTMSSGSGVDYSASGPIQKNGSNIISSELEGVGELSASWSSEVVDAKDASVDDADKNLASLSMEYHIPVTVYDKSKMYTVPSTGKVEPGTQVTSVPGITMTYGGWLTNYNKDKYVSDVYDHDSDFQPIDETNIYDDKGIHLMDNNYLRTDRVAMNHWGHYEDWMNYREPYYVSMGNFFKFEPSQSGKLTIYGFTNGKINYDNNDHPFVPQRYANLYFLDERCGVLHMDSVQQGYSKFSVDVYAGKTYSFFGSSPKSGLCGFYFEPTAVEPSSVVTLSDKNGVEGNPVIGKATRLVYSDRTFKENTWTSIVLPFSMNEKQVAAAFGEGTKVIYFYQLENDTLKFRHYIYDYIIGGTICFIRPTKTVTGIDLSSAGDYQYVTYFDNELYGGSYATTYSTSDGSSYMLDGGYSFYNLNKNDYYLTNNGTLKYMGLNKTAILKPFRGFFRYFAGSYAKAFSPLMMEGLDDMVTEIENRQVIESEVTDDCIYNLQGQRVGNTYKGIVIQNNKKVLRK